MAASHSCCRLVGQRVAKSFCPVRSGPRQGQIACGGTRAFLLVRLAARGSLTARASLPPVTRGCSVAALLTVAVLLANCSVPNQFHRWQ